MQISSARRRSPSQSSSQHDSSQQRALLALNLTLALPNFIPSPLISFLSLTRFHCVPQPPFQYTLLQLPIGVRVFLNWPVVQLLLGAVLQPDSVVISYSAFGKAQGDVRPKL